jgi:hypothetical protein
MHRFRSVLYRFSFVQSATTVSGITCLLRLGGEAATQSDLRHCLRLLGGQCRLLTEPSSSVTLDTIMQLHTQRCTQHPASLPLGLCLPQ